ncbi:unnamed protein product [Taenia asiatica]|uniref:Uncharacterized protein n=1 Tax=Taenia asiatica TaxID=60517 RepID=A0A0R3W068_TAEAS|nr:unnamed protein product [Taenia asiatica]
MFVFLFVASETYTLRKLTTRKALNGVEEEYCDLREGERARTSPQPSPLAVWRMRVHTDGRRLAAPTPIGCLVSDGGGVENGGDAGDGGGGGGGG